MLIKIGQLFLIQKIASQIYFYFLYRLGIYGEIGITLYGWRYPLFAQRF